MRQHLKKGLATLMVTGALVGVGGAIAHAATAGPSAKASSSATSTASGSSSSSTTNTDNCPKH
jgi:hypothetical protein